MLFLIMLLVLMPAEHTNIFAKKFLYKMSALHAGILENMFLLVR